MSDAADKVNMLVSESASLISIRALLVALMNEFGGPVGVAHELKRDFDVAPVGSPLRVRIGTDILCAVQKFGASDDDGDESTVEDKENLVRRLMQKDDE